MRKTMMTLKSAYGLLVLAALVAGGCANYKEPARLALQEIQYSMQAVAGDAKKYLPEQYAQLEQQYAAAKASYDKGDYEATVREVRELRDHISQVSSAASAKREEVTATLNETWRSMSADVPKMVDAVGKKIDSLSKTRRLPKSITQSSFDTAKADYEDMKKMWDEASQAANAGNIESAVSKGTTVQTKGQEVMSMLGGSA